MRLSSNPQQSSNLHGQNVGSTASRNKTNLIGASATSHGQQAMKSSKNKSSGYFDTSAPFQDVVQKYSSKPVKTGSTINHIPTKSGTYHTQSTSHQLQ